MDPETQELALVSDGVPVEHVFRDVGISGTVATMPRRGWRSLQGRLRRGDVMVELAQIGRRWTEVINSVRQLREQGIRIRSLAATEQVWPRNLDADEDAPDYLSRVEAGGLKRPPSLRTRPRLAPTRSASPSPACPAGSRACAECAGRGRGAGRGCSRAASSRW